MNKAEILKTMMEALEDFSLSELLEATLGGNIRVKLGFSKKACDTDISELEFSTRSYNALRRAGLLNVGDLVDRINEDGLKHVRNLGAKSYREIQTKMLLFGFECLSEKEKFAFLSELLEKNPR